HGTKRVVQERAAIPGRKEDRELQRRDAAVTRVMLAALISLRARCPEGDSPSAPRDAPRAPRCDSLPAPHGGCRCDGPRRMAGQRDRDDDGRANPIPSALLLRRRAPTDLLAR